MKRTPKIRRKNRRYRATYMADRNAKIFDRWDREGESIVDIGRAYRLSKQRIWQIVEAEAERRGRKKTA